MWWQHLSWCARGFLSALRLDWQEVNDISTDQTSLYLRFGPPSFGGPSCNLAASFGGQLALPRSTAQLSEMNRVWILLFLLFHSDNVNLSLPVAIEGHLVFSNTVPMQYAWEHMAARVRLSIFKDLDRI